jgi:hypothetical protein
MTLANINRDCTTRDGKAMGSSSMEDAYPQMLESIFMCNAPMFLQVPWRQFRPILPKRVVSKVDFISPETNEKERKRALKFLTENALPVRFGGKNSHCWPVPAFG